MAANDNRINFEFPLLLGTYTSEGPEGSKGIYALNADDPTPYLVGAQPNPSYLIRHPQHKNLVYAVSEGGDEPTSSILVWHFEQAEGNSKVKPSDQPVASFSLQGSGACHLAIQGNLLVTANYGSGSADVVQLDDQGYPIRSLAHIQHEGSGPREDRQDAAHVHWAGFTADGTRILLTDLGTDTVSTYSVETLEALANTEAGTKNDLNVVQRLKLPGGEGPRHIAVAAKNKTGLSDIYVVTELGHRIYHVKDDGKALTIADSYPLLNEADTKDKANTSSAISLSPDGRTVLASERGVDVLVSFRRDPENGSLKHVSTQSSGSQVPREARILPDGTTVAAGHQDGSELVFLELDPETSEIGDVLKQIPISKVVCVLPMD